MSVNTLYEMLHVRCFAGEVRLGHNGVIRPITSSLSIFLNFE